MSDLILYGSQYGAAKYYAEQLSKRTGIPIKSYKEVKNLIGYQRVIYLGGLYASKVKGLKSIIKKLSPTTQLIIVTVGLSDVKNQKTRESIKNAIENQVPKELFNKVTLFYLRGGINYSKLKLSHRLMMTLLYYKCRSLPEEKKTPDVQGIIETFGKKVSFIDKKSLEPIVQYIKK